MYYYYAPGGLYDGFQEMLLLFIKGAADETVCD